MPTNIDNFLKMPTSGFKRWREQRFFLGWNPDGTMQTAQGFKNLLTDQEFIPPTGWDGDLSKLDHGDLANIVHHGGSEEFWQNMAEAAKTPKGQVVKSENNRTVIRY
jgi:hypothetical protein